ASVDPARWPRRLLRLDHRCEGGGQHAPAVFRPDRFARLDDGERRRVRRGAGGNEQRDETQRRLRVPAPGCGRRSRTPGPGRAVRQGDPAGLALSPRILLTNDDGITSPGLHALYDQLKRLGQVTVVAPDAEQSAVGHAITTQVPLRVKEFRRGREAIGYATSGTPADCVKLGVGAIFERRPDLVVSGINLGANTATNVIYSGTVSAA